MEKMAREVDASTRDLVKSLKIGFWGCGKIAQSLANGFIRSGAVAPHNIAAVASTPKSANLAVMKSLGATCYAAIEDMVKDIDVVILAVEPQEGLHVLRKHGLVSDATDKPKALVSLVTGITISDMKKAYQESAVEDCQRTPFVFFRCVPNPATSVQEGVCAVSVEEGCEEHDLCPSVLAMFSLVGCSKLLPEHLMASATAVCGSGLGFMFVVLESMSDAGVLVGFSRDTALELAIQTMMGAAKLAKESKKHPSELKDSVCSPGGTTITGIHELERCGLRNSLLSAARAAKNKTFELGKN